MSRNMQHQDFEAGGSPCIWTVRRRVSLGYANPVVILVLGYPDVLDPYCAQGIVWWGSARSTTMLCSGLFMLRGWLHYGEGPSVFVGLDMGMLH